MQKLVSDGRSNAQLIEVLRSTLSELAVRLSIAVEASRLQQSLTDSFCDVDEHTEDTITLVMMRAAQAIGIRLAPIELGGKDAWELALEGFAVVAIDSRVDGSKATVYSGVSFGRLETTVIETNSKVSEAVTKRQLLRQMKHDNALCFIAEPSLTCEYASSSNQEEHSHSNRVAGSHDHDHSHDDHSHHHLTPLRRMFQFLRSDTRHFWFHRRCSGIVDSTGDRADGHHHRLHEFDTTTYLAGNFVVRSSITLGGDQRLAVFHCGNFAKAHVRSHRWRLVRETATVGTIRDARNLWTRDGQSVL